MTSSVASSTSTNALLLDEPRPVAPGTAAKLSSAKAGHVNRVRTAREDCLDQILVFSRRQLQSVLCQYVRHYNRARPHRGLRLAVPAPSSEPSRDGAVRRHEILGGIIHEYERAA
jgi:hypothetical protein